MSISLNHLTIAGNLTRDPQLRFLANERCVANFGLANNRRFKSGDEDREEVIFLDCEVWGTTAERIGKYFSKGKPIIVEGRLKQETWTDKKDGTRRSKVVLLVEKFHFVPDASRRDQAQPDTAATTSDQAPPAAPASTSAVDADEPPF